MLDRRGDSNYGLVHGPIDSGSAPGVACCDPVGLIAKSCGSSGSERTAGLRKNSSWEWIGSLSVATASNHPTRSVTLIDASGFARVLATIQDCPWMWYWFPVPSQWTCSAKESPGLPGVQARRASARTAQWDTSI